MMGNETMGRVLTEATIENLGDLWDAERGRIAGAAVRRVTVPDALVDTGATMLSLPSRIIRALGLTKRQTRRVRTSRGLHDADIYDAVRLTIGGRDCPTDVIEVSDDTPVLVGQIPLEALDYVIDLRARRLVGNPEHGGEWMYDLY
jgi:predicted aspartyl protease